MEAVLSDVVVIDLARVLAGPYCAMMLGDLGATVIKIERPGRGDDTRHFGPPYVGGESAYYLGLNRNKKSIALDYTQAEGKKQLLELIRNATVLVENFRAGTLEKHGLGYEALRAINPGLIYCSISGYGQTGPRSRLPGYDLVAQGESGLMAVTGEIDGPPVPVGTPLCDVMAGTCACTAILAALRVRDKTGKGQRIDISLFEAAITMLANVASNYLISGDEAPRYGTGHANIVPYQSFATRNGHIVVACGNSTLYTKLCKELGCPELVDDPRFASNPLRDQNRAELVSLLQEKFLERDTEAWLEIFRVAGLPCTHIRKVSEALDDPQLAARGMIWKCDHPTAGEISLFGSPLHLSETPTRLYEAPPLLNEDKEEILASLSCPLSLNGASSSKVEAGSLVHSGDGVLLEVEKRS